MNSLSLFANFFVFAKIFDFKVRKSRVRIVNDYEDTDFARQCGFFFRRIFDFYAL